MVQIIKATGDATGDGVRKGFSILIDDEMAVLEEPNIYLHETCVENGTALSPDTQRTYSEGLYDWFQTCEDNAWEWMEVTKRQVVQYRTRMLENRSPATKRGYAPRTINQRLGEVARFYKHACEKGCVDKPPFVYKNVSAWAHIPNEMNPMAHLTRRVTSKRNTLAPKVTKRLVKVLTTSGLRAVLDTLGPNTKRTTRNRLLAESALTMGLRRIEICGLLCSQVTRTRSALARIVLSITKGGNERAVYPPSAFLDRLRWYIDIDRARIVAAMKKKSGGTYCDPGNVFLTKDGRPMERGTLTKIFKQAARRAKVESATLHWLRHYLPSLAMSGSRITAQDSKAL